MNYRVVYGETMPAWEKIFPTKREAEAFAKEHRSFGDIIFSIRRVVPGEKPQSMIAAIDAGMIRYAVCSPASTRGMKMNKRLKAKWLKLLRSGEIPQARRSLRDGKGLCCIGVGYKALEGRVPPMSYSTNDASQAIGLTNNQESRLVTMNDSRGWGFPAIANWIEKNL